ALPRDPVADSRSTCRDGGRSRRAVFMNPFDDVGTESRFYHRPGLAQLEAGGRILGLRPRLAPAGRPPPAPPRTRHLVVRHLARQRFEILALVGSEGDVERAFQRLVLAPRVLLQTVALRVRHEDLLDANRFDRHTLDDVEAEGAFD